MSVAAVVDASTNEEIRDAVREAVAASRRLIPSGHGTSLPWARPDADGTALLRVGLAGGESGIVEYVPGDGTLTARAGTPWRTLAEAVAEGGHRLTPDLPRCPGTLGGVLGAGLSGEDRVRFGPLRHQVLGMTFVDGKGRAVRSGGRLVKNVTGFDLHRLLAGARGTLGVITEASLRLVPIPEAEACLVFERGSAAEAVELALEVRREPRIQPARLSVHGARLHLGLAGRAAQVATEERLARDTFGACESVASAAGGGAPPAELEIHVRPSRCVEATRALERAGLGEVLGARPAEASLHVGTLAHCADAPALAAQLAAIGARFVPRAAAARPHFPRRVSPGAAPIEARLGERFDPAGVFAESPL